MDPLHLYLVTFNCARNLVQPESLAPALFDALPPAAEPPDILALSLQEVAPIAYSFLGGACLAPYFDRLELTVRLAVQLHGHGVHWLQHVATRNLGLTAVMLFAKPHVVERISWLQTAAAGVGLWNMGNKGAVALRLGLSLVGDDELVLSFVAAHLAPMEWNCEARNCNWEAIVRNLVFTAQDGLGGTGGEERPLLAPRAPLDSSGLYVPHTHVFFWGDLNYRTHDQAPGALAYQSYPQPRQPESSPLHWSRHLETDQLSREKEAKRTLHGLHEQPIRFPPTYKYSTKRLQTKSTHKRSQSDAEDAWNWAKHRFPSWCDRILYVPSPAGSTQLTARTYTCLPIQPTSDHRPVALSLRVDSEPAAVGSPADIRANPPFPINPRWRARKNAARRLEIAVGVLSYLVLTRRGNVIVVAIAGFAFLCWWLVGRP